MGNLCGENHLHTFTSSSTSSSCYDFAICARLQFPQLLPLGSLFPTITPALPTHTFYSQFPFCYPHPAAQTHDIPHTAITLHTLPCYLPHIYPTHSPLVLHTYILHTHTHTHFILYTRCHTHTHMPGCGLVRSLYVRPITVLFSRTDARPGGSACLALFCHLLLVAVLPAPGLPYPPLWAYAFSLFSSVHCWRHSRTYLPGLTFWSWVLNGRQRAAPFCLTVYCGFPPPVLHARWTHHALPPLHTHLPHTGFFAALVYLLCLPAIPPPPSPTTYTCPHTPPPHTPTCPTLYKPGRRHGLRDGGQRCCVIGTAARMA